MSELLEIKGLIKDLSEQEQKMAAVYRAELDSVKNADVVTETKLTNIQTGLASVIAENVDMKSRLSEMEAKANRLNVAGAKAEEKDEHKAAFLEYLRNPNDHSVKSNLANFERKMVNVSTGASGGFAVPKTVAAKIDETVRNLNPMRQIANVVTVADKYVELVSNGDLGAGWIGEMDVRPLTSDPTFTEVVAPSGEVYSLTKVTEWALTDVAFDLEAFIISEAAKAIAEKEDAAFINGDGVKKPSGLLNGTAIQFDKTGAAANFGSAPIDNFLAPVMGLKVGYRANAKFLMNSLTLAKLYGFKDSTGVALIQPNVASAFQGVLFGHDIVVDENMPSVAAGTMPVIFGDFSRGYLITDIANSARVTVANISEPGFVKIYVRKRVGGIVRDAQALRGLKVSA